MANQRNLFKKTHWTGGVESGFFPAACGASGGRLLTNVSAWPSDVTCERCRRCIRAAGRETC